MPCLASKAQDVSFLTSEWDHMHPAIECCSVHSLLPLPWMVSSWSRHDNKWVCGLIEATGFSNSTVCTRQARNISE